MSDLSSLHKGKLDFNKQTEDGQPQLETDLRAEKLDGMRRKVSGLGSIRISQPATRRAAEEGHHDLAVEASLGGATAGAENRSMVLVSSFWIVSILWMAYGLGYFIEAGIDGSPQDIASVLMTLCAPPALLWYGLSQLSARAGGAAAVRAELQAFFGVGRDEFSKDVDAFYQQAHEISSTSKAVLKSLQRARQGLRIEMRDFSGVSEKAEAQVERLTQSLHERTEKLATLMSDIEGRIDALDDKAMQGTKAWDEASVTLVERSQAIETALSSGADKILSAADQAQDRTLDIKDNLLSGFDELNQAVDNIASRFETIESRFSGHAESLNDVVDHVSRETERLTDTIKDQVEDLEGSAGRTVASVIEAAGTISMHKEHMESSVLALSEQSKRVGELVQQSVDQLREGVDYAAAQADKLEERLHSREDSFKDTIRGIARQADMIEEVGDQAANKLAESLSVAVGGAESISFAIRRAVDSLNDSNTKAQDKASAIVDDVTRYLDQLQEKSETNSERLERAASLLSESNAMIAEASEKAHKQMEGLSTTVEAQNVRMEKVVSALSGSVASVGTTLSQSLRDIQSAINEADSRHATLESVLSRRVSDLNAASEKAVQATDDIRASLRTQIQEVSSLSGQLSGQGRAMGDYMLLQKEQLSGAVETALSDIEKVGAVLERQVAAVKGSADDAAKQLEGVSNIVAERYDALSGFGAQAEARFESLDGLLMDKLSTLYDESDKAQKSFVKLQGEIDETLRSMAPVCEHALAQADTLTQRYDDLRASCHATTESSLARFKQFGVVIEGNLDDLKEGSAQASVLLDSVSQILSQRAEGLRETAKASVHDIETAADSLRDQSDAIRLLGDQTVLKMDTVQGEVKDQFMDFSASVARAVEQLQDAGKAFTLQADSVQDEIKENTLLLEKTGAQAREEVLLLSESTQKVSRDTDEMVAYVKTKAQDLFAGTQVVLSDFKKTADMLSIRTRELSEQMKSSLQTSEMYGRELKGQVSVVAGSSIEVAEQVGKAVSMLNSSIDNLGRHAHDTTSDIAVAREKLSIEADRLMQVSGAALEVTKDASDTFTKQSEAMFKAVRDVQDFAKGVKEQDGKLQRESFLNASRFIVESLHSLSVDVSRLLEGGDVSEKAWQAFQRGDISIFTRRLAALGANWPLERAQEKFRKDTEFRTYVQRFIRQFEEVYEQASSNDYGALMSTAIGSSDVARLYDMLCKVASRESKVSSAAESKRVA